MKKLNMSQTLEDVRIVISKIKVLRYKLKNCNFTLNLCTNMFFLSFI